MNIRSICWLCIFLGHGMEGRSGIADANYIDIIQTYINIFFLHTQFVWSE